VALVFGDNFYISTHLISALFSIWFHSLSIIDMGAFQFSAELSTVNPTII
jgi:hypothetical protein